ncbi:LolA family protein [Mucilaginibacter terrae]|uniref:Outer membrane lipoprotein-sorting protein n=1 Tax=Mucilaginibacter terrae TaxID=1955052 RepID=A0ABU3GS97_9SPHI|nr:outer membrane lipoprotein carrier protein LolA [Mucilaginibacter terrae]MDT3402520.1 outer membrane lipoprotein-sorting protein [Mucilaginibacter terrae]
MKNLFAYLIILISTAPTALAQKDADAKAILSGVGQKYRSYNTVKSDFTLTIANPQEGVNQTQNGTLITQVKANKYKLSFFSNTTKKALTQEIISDGKTQWTYMPAQKEVQINDANTTEGINPAQIFTLYEKGYKYIYTGLQKQAGKTYQVVELTPTDAKQSIFKIRLLIDKMKKQIYNAQLFDKNGGRYNYTINTFTPDVSVAANTFTFNPKAYTGVEVVDLR